MNEYEFQKGIERITDNWNELKPGIVSELESRYRGLNPKLWQAMVTWILDRCKFAPRVANFREAHDACKGGHREEVTNDCDKCKGERFLTVYFMCNGLAYRGAETCDCHPLHGKWGKNLHHAKIDRMITQEEHEEFWEKYRAGTLLPEPRVPEEPEAELGIQWKGDQRDEAF